MKLKRLNNSVPSWRLDDMYDIYYDDSPDKKGLYIVKKGQKKTDGFIYTPKQITRNGIIQEQGLKDYEDN